MMIGEAAKNIKLKLWKEVVSKRIVTFGIISGSYPVADFIVSCVIPWTFATRNLVLRKLLRWDPYGAVSWLCPGADYLNFGPFRRVRS
jgi:hypothetical protein